MHRLRCASTRFLTVFVALAWMVGGAGTAHASCIAPPPTGRAVKEADIVFVGTVIETTNDDRWARVAVEEVWKGENTDPVVQIKAGPADPPGELSVASSTDRTFEEGVRYLFFPYRDKGGLSDSSCSNTTRFTSELERFRPLAAQDPRSLTGDEPDESLVIAVFVGATAGLVVSLVIVFARRRFTD